MYICNISGNRFERPIRVTSVEYGDETLCPCCHDADFDELVSCDICHGDTTDSDEARLSTGSVICPDCRKSAIVTLFDVGASELGVLEEDYLDDLLEIGFSWSDMKKLYKEAKKC